MTGSVTPPPPPAPRPGLVGWVRAWLTDAGAWRAAGYLLLKVPVAALGLVVVQLFWVYGLLFLTMPAWRHAAARARAQCT